MSRPFHGFREGVVKQSLLTASVLLVWVFGLTAQVTSVEFGPELEGWEPSGHGWSVREGRLIGEVAEGEPPAWLAWRGDLPPNFVLECDVKCSGDGEGGLLYRAAAKRGGWRGYEFRIDARADRYGRLYEFGRRGLIARRGERVSVSTTNVRPQVVGVVPDPPTFPDRWQRLRIRVRGGSVLHRVGDRDVLELADEWRDAPREGRLV